MDDLSSPSDLHYGKAFADALHGRLRSHFASLDQNGAQEAPLTIGLFGGWGSGKTKHLHYLRDRVQSQAVIGEGVITLPVLFNAWRHEAEDHLVVPLLKTTHFALEHWLESQQTIVDTLGDTVKTGLKASAIQLKDAALALAAGLKGKLSLPLLGEIEIDAGAMLAEDARRQAARNPESAVSRRFARSFHRQAPSPSRLDTLDAIYHDFETHMRQLTGAGGKGARLNLLFLIDDLDRCLPEKAVQMLESIKLFLDVPGCAFVLALDDEIVERGIAHRYRDYRQDDPAFDSIAHSLHPARWESFRARHGNASANPVSGFEYLEKMVQLPVQVPRPAAAEVHSYLQRFYPALFAELPPQPQPDPHDPHDKDAPARDLNAAENRTRNQLLDLIKRAVPANPRKLNRVAELYGFWLKVAEGNSWSMHRLTLLRLAILQLLAPDLYRFGQHQTAFLAKLESWLRDEPQARVQGALERRLKELRNGYEQQQSASDLRQLERLDEPLLARLRTAQNHRSQFDPFDLLDAASPCEPLPAYYRLGREPAAVVEAAVVMAMSMSLEIGVTGTAATAAIPAGIPPQPIAALAHREPFIDQLLSSDPLAWRTALEQEAAALDGHVLDNASFQALLDGITRKPEHVTLAWLEPMAPHLTTAQLLELYRAGKLLTRLNAAIPNASPEPPP